MSTTEEQEKTNPEASVDAESKKDAEDSSWTIQSSKRRLVPEHSLTTQDLGADGGRNKASTETKKTDAGSSTSKGEPGEEDQESWTLPSTKRRLVPQHSLTTQDMGADNSKKAAQDKKKVARLTKDELLRLRKPSAKLAPGMSEMLEILSISTLDPVCFQKFDQEDVIAIIHANDKSKEQPNLHKNKSKPKDGEQGQGSEWSRNVPVERRERDGMWDDGGGKNADGSARVGFDLSDFAAASERFREDMQRMAKQSDQVEEEDALELLLKDQIGAKVKPAPAGADDDLGGLLQGDVPVEDDDDEMPDWADDSPPDAAFEFMGGAPTTATKPSNESRAAAASSSGSGGEKRNLLMETLNVKSPGPTPIANVPSTASVSASNHQLVSSNIHATNMSNQPLSLNPLPLGDSRLLPTTQSVTTAPSNVPALNFDPIRLDDPLLLLRQPPPQSNVLFPSFAIQTPALPPQPVEYFYTDPQQQVQGPFSQTNMRQWHEAGYFHRELPIKRSGWTRFYPFHVIFPDPKMAFMGLPNEPLPRQPAMPFAAPISQTGVMPQQGSSAGQQMMHDQFARQQAQQQAQAQAKAKAQLLAQQEQLRTREHLERIALTSDTRPSQQQLVVNDMDMASRRIDPQRPEANNGASTSNMAGANLLSKLRGPANGSDVLTDQTSPVKPVSSMQQPAVGPPAAAWNKPSGGNDAGSVEAKANLKEIQAREEMQRREQQLREPKRDNGAPWKNSDEKPVSALADILKDEEQARRKQQQQQQQLINDANNGAIMSNQLKSMLGMRNIANNGKNSAGWGGQLMTAAESRAASLRDIMQEEERASETEPVGVATRTSGPPARNSKQPQSWAAKTGVGINASNMNPSVSAPSSNSVSVASSATSPKQPLAPNPAAVVNAANEARNNLKSTIVCEGVRSGSSSDFGGKLMSRELVLWCSVQLQRLTGSSDVTLMKFCMSLNSPTEIREYLAEYLGSSVMVSNFATDFIKFKDGTQMPVATSVAPTPTQFTGLLDHGHAHGRPHQQQGFVIASKKKKAGK